MWANARKGRMIIRRMGKMQIRKARWDEIDSIMGMYETGRQFMREHGNQMQWTGGYPQREVVEADYNAGNLYLCEEEGKPVAVFMYQKGEDPNYARIEQGEWLNEKPYGVIHRIVSLGTVKGAASFCVNWGFEACKNLKIDTHETNFPMQNMLKKNGFSPCGIVYMEDGSPRIAFQKAE